MMPKTPTLPLVAHRCSESYNSRLSVETLLKELSQIGGAGHRPACYNHGALAKIAKGVHA
jgi:hypothetical protein